LRIPIPTPLFLVCALTLAPPPTGLLAAQNPTAEQVSRTLRERPDVAQDVRQRIVASGMTTDQIRARLTAAGYPANLLDPYLPTADLAALTGATDDRVFGAVKALGLAGAAEADALASAVRASNIATPAPAGMAGGGDDIFGLEIFRRATSEFQPTLSGPVDASYRLGPGDVLVLVLTGEVELSHTLEVNREGFVVIPQVGQLFVNGLTMEAFESALYGRLGKVYSGVGRTPDSPTKFQISVARLRTNQIFVVGEVVRPGSFLISGAGTTMTALYAAGGPTTDGSMRRILVRRAGRVVDSLDIYDYLLRGDSRHDARLENGDVVFVPVRGMHVRIGGEIVRPRTYELRSTETLRDLLQVAGGLRASALRRVQIDRMLPPGERRPGGRDRVVLDIGPEQFSDGIAPALPLQAGDEVRVFSIAGRRRAFVSVAGNVWTEGRVGFTAGMRLSDALRMAGGPKPDVYLGTILVSRLSPDSTRNQLRTAFRDSTGTLTSDLALQEDDEIRVFSRTDFRPSRFVAVTGAVRSPGRIPYREGMTLRDALLLVQGLTEDASLREAEIARMPTDRSGGAMSVPFRVALDSTFLFDRDPAGKYLGPPGESGPRAGSAETVLQPYDNVLIFRQPDWEFQRLVTLSGQVRYPGRYALLRRDERLTDLVTRAGGLTPVAYPAGIRFFRADDAPKPATASGLSGPRTRLGLDLPRVLENPQDRDNLILAAGDSIEIPEFSPVVKVTGAVNAPTGVSYVPGKNLDFYIGAAGGFAPKGDKGRAYVEQPSGKIQSVNRRFFIIPDSKPDPQPGAIVMVPEKPVMEKTNWVGISAIASILASMVTMLVVTIK